MVGDFFLDNMRHMNAYDSSSSVQQVGFHGMALHSGSVGLKSLYRW